jgi:chemotaxis protein CheD
MITAISKGSFHISNNRHDALVVYPVHEGLGVLIHDAMAGVGGALHFAKPDSKDDPEQAKQAPSLFADTGIAAFLWELFKAGGSRKGVQVKLVGGTDFVPGKPDVGQQNAMTAKRILWKHSLVVAKEAIGCGLGTHIKLDMATGAVTVKARGEQITL